MNDRTAPGRLDQRRIFLDRVEHFHLVAPPTSPGGDANVVLHEQRCNFIGFVGVVKGADLESELARDVDHVRHLVGAITMIRSEEHTSELQSLMRISYAVFCLKKTTAKI